MDYEKAYNDIVSKIRQIHNCPKSAVKEGMYFNGYVESGIRDAMEALIPFDTEDEKFARIVLDLPFKHEADYKFVRAYLERQKEQKPAEWSEEDEKMRIRCIEIFDEILKSSYVYAYTHDCKNWCENRLKSLCPQSHWKPSEEQMRALMWQIKNTSEGSWRRMASESLYNDLQKLL